MEEVKRLLELTGKKDDVASEVELKAIVQKFDEEEQILNSRNLLFPQTTAAPDEEA